MGTTEPWLQRYQSVGMQMQMYHHVFSTLHPAGAVVSHQAVSYNHFSKGRLALIGGSTGMFYVGTTEMAALWETILAHAKVYPDGGVYVDPKFIANMALAQVMLIEPTNIFDLRQPKRRLLMDIDSPLDQAWTELLGSLKYDKTQDVAKTVQAEVVAQGISLAGFAWGSRRVQEDSVFLLYDPPSNGGHWQVGSIVKLDSPAGDKHIDTILRANNYYWLGDPSTGSSMPPAGAL